MVPQMKANCLIGHYIIFASLLKHCPKTHISEQFNEIISMMIENNFCETREVIRDLILTFHRNFKFIACSPFLLQLISLQSLLKIISKLIDCCEGVSLDDNSLKNLHLAILSTMAFGNEDIRNEAAGTLSLLATYLMLSSYSLL